MGLSTIGSIATHVAESFVLPNGVSGNLVETVDMARVDVQNYTGQSIGSNLIEEKYQSVITNFSKAQAIDEAFAWAATVGVSGTSGIYTSGAYSADKLSLAELSVESEASSESDALNAISSLSKDTPVQFRQLAMDGLKNIGRKIRFAKSLS